MAKPVRVLSDEEIIVAALRDYATAQAAMATPANAGLPSWREFRRRADRARRLAHEYRRSIPAAEAPPLAVDSLPGEARFDGHCPGCETPIFQGQQIVRLTDGSHRHDLVGCRP